MRLTVVKGPVAPMRRLEPEAGVRLRTAVQDAARREANAIVDEAREDARRLVAAARAEAAGVEDEARRLGTRDGADRWTQAALALASAHAEALATLEREALALALEVARRIVRSHVASSSEAWAELVATSTSRLRRDGTLVIRFAPSDESRLEAVRERLASFREVTFERDDTLEAGDCIAECSGVRVDARIDVQIAAIERLLCSGQDKGATQ